MSQEIFKINFSIFQTIFHKDCSPINFLEEKGNLKFDIMEPKQSVHIKPKYYIKENQKQLTLF